MFINVKSISERTLHKLETMTASGEDNLFFTVFPFVTFELCTMYKYYLFKSKVFLKEPLVLKIYFMYHEITKKSQTAVSLTFSVMQII